MEVRQPHATCNNSPGYVKLCYVVLGYFKLCYVMLCYLGNFWELMLINVNQP